MTLVRAPFPPKEAPSWELYPQPYGEDFRRPLRLQKAGVDALALGGSLHPILIFAVLGREIPSLGSVLSGQPLPVAF
jgi:hypothetical protein